MRVIRGRDKALDADWGMHGVVHTLSLQQLAGGAGLGRRGRASGRAWAGGAARRPEIPAAASLRPMSWQLAAGRAGSASGVRHEIRAEPPGQGLEGTVDAPAAPVPGI